MNFLRNKSIFIMNYSDLRIMSYYKTNYPTTAQACILQLVCTVFIVFMNPGGDFCFLFAYIVKEISL